MSSMSVGGLMTGFDTKAVVEQLMAVERSAGNRLVTAQTKATSLSSALTRLNGLVKTMGDAAKALVPDTIFKTSAWNAAAATSSSDAVKATAGENATTGSVTFKVAAIAQAGASVSAQTFAARDSALSDTDFSFNINTGSDPLSDTAKSTKISLAGGATLNDVAKAINDSDSGVNATIVQVSQGAYRLQLTSKETGAASNVTLTDGNTPPGAHNLLGSFNTLYNGTDARLTVGEGTGAYDVTSSTNKIDGLLQGVSIEVNKATTEPVMVGVSRDAGSIADKVQAMVDAANGALSNVRINSLVDPNLGRADAGKPFTNNSGVFMGNSTARSVTNEITNVFVGSSENLPSMAGISITRDGTVTFDRAKFLAEYSKDPAAVEKNVTDSAQKLTDVSKNLTNSANGVLTSAIEGQNRIVKDYGAQIKRFDDRMEMKHQMLTRQFDALDSMLSKMKAQGDWLAGQLKTLPTGTSNG